MIVGVGIDLCSVARMRKELDRSNGFETTAFTSTEIATTLLAPHPTRRFAALFAAKEAVVKALAGAKPAGMLWRDIEVGESVGTAEVTLNGHARDAADSLNIDHIRVAFTHTETEAMACAFATSSIQETCIQGAEK
jgi:holo-[acyl-carrier protein] synthase